MKTIDMLRSSNISNKDIILYEAHKKNGIGCAIINFFFPTLGYIYTGDRRSFYFVWGVVMFFSFLVYFFGNGSLLSSIGAMIFLFYFPMSILTFIDGFFSAGRANKKLAQKIISQNG